LGQSPTVLLEFLSRLGELYSGITLPAADSKHQRDDM
jgi:hypothetical protein